MSGMLSAGANCTYFLKSEREHIDMGEFLKLLEPQDAWKDPIDPSKSIPRKAAAIVMSAKDFLELKMEHEQMCRMLGDKCKVPVAPQPSMK